MRSRVPDATFLFVDMVASTQLLASVGDIASNEIRRDVFEVLRRPLDVFGGVEVKSQGDGLMAVFLGDFETALGSAVAMQQGVAAVDAARNYLPLRVRVGLSRGEATAEDEDWFGTPVVEAARLCSLATPGQVLFTDRSRRLGRSTSWPVRQVGPLNLKGFAEPVNCSEVVWSPIDATPLLPIPPTLSIVGTPGLVDRDRELGALRLAWAAVCEGDGQAVLISGPPRAGCSRLVGELVAELTGGGNEASHPLVLGGTIRRGDPGFEGLGEALRWPVWWGERRLGGAVAAVEGSEQLVPSLPARSTSMRPAVDSNLDPDGAARIAERVLSGLARHGRVVLVVENLQWGADDMLRAVASLFAMRIPGVLQIATSRSPDVPDAPTERLLAGKLRGIPHVSTVELAPLSLSGVSDVLSAYGVGRAAATRWAGEVISRVGDLPGEVVDAGRRLRSLDTKEASALATLSLASPYKGLLSFQESDAQVFFGRDEQVDHIVSRLQRDRFVVLVGASGSGKSSLLRAGVGPAMTFSDARSIVMTPATVGASGMDPIMIRPGQGGFIIDQFEEAFTTLDEPGRAQFLDAVAEAVEAVITESDPPGESAIRQQWMAIGVRADFYAHFAANARLAQLVADHTVLVGPVGEDEIRSMVEGPARLAGIRVEPGLCDVVAGDVEGERHPLPLVSQAMREAWRRRQAGRLTIGDYREAGGVRGAIAATAERVYTTELSSAEQDQARRLLLRLVDLEGLGDQPIRRSIRLVEAHEDARGSVIDRLVAARLVVVDEGTITLAHDALLQAWPRLSEWIVEDREQLVTARRLSRAAADWDTAGRPDTDLYRGVRLDAAHSLRSVVPLTRTEEVFVEESLAVQQRDRTRLIRSNRRLRRLLISVAVATVVSVLLGGVAVVLGRRAAAERASALTELRSEQIGRLASDAETLAGNNIGLASLLAVEAYRLAPRPDTLTALETVLRAEPALQQVRELTGLPAAATPLPGDPAGQVVLYKSGVNIIPVNIGSFANHPILVIPDATSGAVAPDGRTAAVATAEATLVLGDVATGRLSPPIYLPEPASDVTFLGDQTVVVGSAAGRLTAIDVATGAMTSWMSNPYISGFPAAVATDRTDHLVAIAPNPEYGQTTSVDVVSAGSLVPLRHIDLPVGGIPSLAFQPGGHLLAVGTVGDGVLLVDPRTGRQVAGPGRSQLTGSPLFSPDGKRLATIDSAGTVNVYSVDPIRPLITPVTQTFSGTATLRFAPDGLSLYELSGRQAITISLNGSQPLASPPFGIPGQRAEAILPDGRIAYSAIVSANLGTISTAYDPETGRQLAPASPENLLQYSPDASFALVAGASYTQAESVTPSGRVIAVSSFPLNGADVVAENRDLTLCLLIANDQSEIALDRLPSMTPMPIRLLPDGTILTAGALSDDGTLAARAGTSYGPPNLAQTIIDVSRVDSGQNVAHYAVPWTSEEVTAVAFSPDGHSLAVGDASGNIGVLDVQTGAFEPAVYPGIRGRVQQIVYTGNGQQVFASGTDGTVWWWDTASHTPIGSPFPADMESQHLGLAPAANFDANVRWLLTANNTDGLRLWNIDIRTWSAIACRRAGRNLTAAEWHHYLPTGLAYHPSCSSNS